MKTEKKISKTKGLTDKQLIEKYEAGKIDLVKALKKGIGKTNDNSKFVQPKLISKN